MKSMTKILLFAFIGAGLGYAYYHYFGCTTGCPIKSSWKLTTLYGTVFGLVLALPTKRKSIKK